MRQVVHAGRIDVPSLVGVTAKGWKEGACGGVMSTTVQVILEVAVLRMVPLGMAHLRKVYRLSVFDGAGPGAVPKAYRLPSLEGTGSKRR